MREDAKDTVSVSNNYRWHIDDFKSQHIPDIIHSTARKKNEALELFELKFSSLGGTKTKSQLQSLTQATITK